MSDGGMDWGVDEPRWCGFCHLVVKGELVAQLGDRAVGGCPRCKGPLSPDETPEITTEKARVGAIAPEDPQACVFCMKKVGPYDHYTVFVGTHSYYVFGTAYIHNRCLDRLQAYGLRVTSSTEEQSAPATSGVPRE